MLHRPPVSLPPPSHPRGADDRALLTLRSPQPQTRVELFGEMGDWLGPHHVFDAGEPVQLRLPPGVYAYKLRLDGTWNLDPSNSRTRSLRGQRNNVLSVGGTPEPVLFAPGLPFVFVDDQGALTITAALRLGHGSSLRVRWAEAADAIEHRTDMHPVLHEDEHVVFRARLPVSSSEVVLRFELQDGSLVGREPDQEPFRIAVRSAAWPSWWPGSVLYTIFVDRFRPATDRDDWHLNPGVDKAAGGHLEGIRRSLPELRELGVTVLYLTPIHVAATCHRYDLIDPFQIDPALGGEQAFRHLLDDAHATGLRVLLDFSFAHAGRGFPPLEHVLAHGRASPFADWFCWTDEPEPGLRQYGKRSDAPLLNLHHPEVREMVLRAAEHWARFGIDGLRLDAAAEVPLDLARQVRERVREVRPDALVFGEVVPRHAWRWIAEGAVDAATDFASHGALTDFIATRTIDAAEAAQRLVENDVTRGLPATASVRFLSTHDHARFATLARLHHDPARTALGLLLLMALPGVPALLYGEEVGLAADVAELEPEHAWLDRAPMLWDAAKRDERLRSLVRRLLQVRARMPALRTGELAIVYAEGPVLVVRRSGAGQVLDVVANASNETLELQLEDDRWDGLEPLVTVGPVHVRGQTVVLGANAGLVARRHVVDRVAKMRRAIQGNLALIKREFRAGVTQVGSRPIRIDLSLTERCNLQCAHCINDSPSRSRQGTARVMSPAVLERLREHFGFAQYVGFVHGGESLCSPLLFDVLHAIRDERGPAPCTIHLLSNGMMLSPETVQRLVESGVNSLSVSIDGATADTNDRIRKQSRLDRVVSNLREVVRLRRATNADVRVGVSFVIMQANLHQVQQVVELAASLGLDWVKLEELVAKNDVGRAQLPTDQAAVRRAVEQAVERGGALGIRVVDHVDAPPVWPCKLVDDPRAASFLAADEFANRSRIHPCRAPWEHACVDPNGDVRIGDFWGPIIGNLMEDDLAVLWASGAAQSERERAMAHRPCGKRGCEMLSRA